MTAPASPQIQRELTFTERDLEEVTRLIPAGERFRDWMRLLDCVQSRPHTPAPSLIITDMEGDAIGDCSDCEAHYESMGESDKLPCSKEALAAIAHTATLAIKDWACKHKHQVTDWNDGCPFIWWYELRDELDKSLRTTAGDEQDKYQQGGQAMSRERNVKKSAVERYNDMDKKSSEERWNDDFGIIVLEVFERAIKEGKLNKTVKTLVDEIGIHVQEMQHP
jgi:hypothetical protein